MVLILFHLRFIHFGLHEIILLFSENYNKDFIKVEMPYELLFDYFRTFFILFLFNFRTNQQNS